MHAVNITAHFYNLLIFSLSETSLHIYIPTGHFVQQYSYTTNREHYGVAGLLWTTTLPERGWS